MYGWRCRIGYIGGPGVSVPLYDMWRFAPAGVTTVTSTMSGDISGRHAAGAPFAQGLWEAASELGEYGVDIVLAGSRLWPGSVTFEQRQADLQGLLPVLGCEAHVEVAAGLEFLRHCHVDHVLVVHATQGEEENEEALHLGQFIERWGFDVTISSAVPSARGAVDRELPFSAVVEANRSWKSKTGRRGVLLWPPEAHTHDLAGLEEELRVPVVNVGAAGVWFGLRSGSYPIDVDGRLSRLRLVLEGTAAIEKP